MPVSSIDRRAPSHRPAARTPGSVTSMTAAPWREAPSSEASTLPRREEDAPMPESTVRQVENEKLDITRASALYAAMHTSIMKPVAAAPPAPASETIESIRLQARQQRWPWRLARGKGSRGPLRTIA